MAMRNKFMIPNNTVIFIFAYLLLYSPEIFPQNNKPNILFITVDDLRPELNCYGASHIKTPNIDRLASEGILFENAHVQQAICMASRASVLSGIRPEKHKIFTGESLSKLLPDVLTLNKFFKQNGYSTPALGKVYHYKEDTEQQFGIDYIKPKKTWTGRGYITHDAIAKISLNTVHHRGPAFELADVPDSIYVDGINTLNAVRKLRDLKLENKPFMMSIGFSKPHLPFVAPKKYWDLYDQTQINLPKLSQMPKNANDFTLRKSGELTNYYGIPNKYDLIEDSLTLSLRHAYYACISYVDAQIGLLLDELERLDLREETIVILWGDHGYKVGEYRAWCKWSNMHIDTHIPLIISAPGYIKGKNSQAMVEALDIYPTLVELSGFSKPDHIEGKSLVSFLKNPHKKGNRFIRTLWPHNRQDYEKTIIGYSIKNQRFNYVKWIKLNTGELLATELYDHKKDPLETVNEVNNKLYKNSIKKLDRKLSAIYK